MKLVTHTAILVALIHSLLINSPLSFSAPADGDIDPGENSLEEMAKSAQNPVAAMISVPFQNNTNFNVGPEEETQNVLNIQPVIPFDFSENWNLITRTIIPVISQPKFAPGQDRENGIGDIQFSAFLSPKKTGSGGWVWGAGPIAQLDTATDDRLGARRWGLGPSVVVLRPAGAWVYGALINNVWDVGGDNDRNDINQMLIQPFVNYNFADKPGRYLTFAPIITANWEADSDNTWTVPLGGGLGQIIKWGDTPVNLQASAYYNVETPKNGADWQMRLQVQFLFPK
jgi:hypothetical protein